MMTHVTNKELGRYIAGTAKERQHGRIAEHLAACGRCRARHDKMTAAIAPRYSMLRASDAARVRVLRSRDRLAEDETASAPAGIRSLLSLHPRAALAGSLALAATVVTAAVLLFRPPAEEARPHLAAPYFTLHAAAGSPTRRRVVSLRLVGDAVRWAPRPHRTSPPYPEVGLSAGDPLEHDGFPELWHAT